jgi:hypothetical protein
MMIVYGDLERVESAGEAIASVASAVLRVGETSVGIDRHARLVGAFIRAAELVQGIADAEFERHGFDQRSAAQDAGAVLLLKMAETVDRSWRSGFQASVDVEKLLQLLQQLRWDGIIKTRTGEGYAHYALYPESYLEAARRSGLAASTCVIGIRSIGIGLGALVAAALGARPAISLRPVGHPFDREIRAAAGLLGSSAADAGTDFAIVDEGPGMSGSSFASVARWLHGHGVPPSRIHFFPSHDGQPGPSATSETRTAWEAVRRHAASPEDVVVAPTNGLRSWIEENIGPLQRNLEDVSSAPHLTGASLQPIDGRFTRCKFLARNADGRWLIKFAGIGETGERKFRDAAALARAGFAPEPAALCYGFLVQRWVDGRRLDEFAYDRNAFLTVLASYLAFRAAELGPPGAGASLAELREMAVYNTSQALGAEAAAGLGHRLADLPSRQDRVRRVRTDNRLHVWKWLATETAFLKTDAVDHCEGHDLIGCQDIAWDVAGSVVEHSLTEDETTGLCQALRSAEDLEVDDEMVAMLLPCYLAFQLGLWTTATPASIETEALATKYAKKLSGLLHHP